MREYVIGRFRLQPGRQLLADGVPVPLGVRALNLLAVLVEAGGDLVTKDEVMARAWSGAIVEENAIQAQITALRKILGANAITTVRGRGYRFAAPGEALPAVRDNLPRTLTRLIGREAELTQLAALLAEHRLVTVLGAGGLGKTRLALQLASEIEGRFPDGVWLVALERLQAPEQVLEAIARTFGLRSSPGREIGEVVTTFLSHRATLLILDNAEHLVAEVARVAEAILTGGSWVRIVATSREVLGVPHEQVFRVPPLGFPYMTEGLSAAAAIAYPAVRLLVERAAAALGDYGLTDTTAPAVGEICRRLDGIALALELAAPRLKLLTPAALLARLEDRFRVLVGGSRTAPPRQQTLEAAIGWSYDLLATDERLALQQLAVFGGSFDIDSATAVAASDSLGLLTALLDKSLVSPLPETDAAPRYRLLDSTRAFALARLGPAERARCLRRLGQHLVARLTEGQSAHRTMPTDAWLACYGAELDNLRVTLDWAFGPEGDTALGVTLVARSTELLLELLLEPERLRWLATARARMDPSTPGGDRGRILMASAPQQLGRREGLTLALEAADLFQAGGESMFQGSALLMAGVALARPGDGAEAVAMLDAAEALIRPHGASRTLIAVLSMQATVKSFTGDLAGARRLHEASLAMSHALGMRGWAETLQINLAEFDFADGRTRQAIDRALEAQQSCRRSGNLRGLATATQNLAGYQLAVGLVELGREAAREALALKRALGGQNRLVPCLEYLALIAALDGDLPGAARLAGYGEAHYHTEGGRREPTEQACWAALATRLAALPVTDRDRLMGEGAAWTTAEAIAAATGR